MQMQCFPNGASSRLACNGPVDVNHIGVTSNLGSRWTSGGAGVGSTIFIMVEDKQQMFSGDIEHEVDAPPARPVPELEPTNARDGAVIGRRDAGLLVWERGDIKVTGWWAERRAKPALARTVQHQLLPGTITNPSPTP
jgi:hypothetical protein